MHIVTPKPHGRAAYSRCTQKVTRLSYFPTTWTNIVVRVGGRGRIRSSWILASPIRGSGPVSRSSKQLLLSHFENGLDMCHKWDRRLSRWPRNIAIEKVTISTMMSGWVLYACNSIEIFIWVVHGTYNGVCLLKLADRKECGLSNYHLVIMEV